jgi:osmotically-inducible protein OsmY
MIRRVLASAALFTLLTAPAFAQTRTNVVPPRAAASDQLLADRIAEKIVRYSFYTIFDDVQGHVENGLVTLTGKVTAPHKAKDIARLVAKVSGVREVDNKIEALPVSTYDDQLRVAVAMSIYHDDVFLSHAMQVNPPIHIIVDHGHVTLTGVVNNELERRVAEMKAREPFGSFSVTNQLTLDTDAAN